MVNVKIQWQAAPGSIWAKLAEKLGREPTNAEAKAEVLRILNDAAQRRAKA